MREERSGVRVRDEGEQGERDEGGNVSDEEGEVREQTYDVRGRRVEV